MYSIIEVSMRPNIVVPSNRPDRMIQFLRDWNTELQGCNLIIVWDLPVIPDTSLFDGVGYSVEQYSHREIDMMLGDKSWIIPRKSSAIRSFGIWKAYTNDPLFIVTLDDDTKPYTNGHINQFYNILFNHSKDELIPETNWISTTKRFLPRGTTKGYNNIVLVHGGWTGIPDYKAKDQILHNGQSIHGELSFNELVITPGTYFSMCGMNIAFNKDIAEYLYFGLQGFHKNGTKFPVSRADDIMAGMYLSNSLKGSTSCFYSGEPFVIHDRASNAWTNLEKEENDEQVLFEYQMYLEDDDTPGLEYNEYFKKLREAYSIWKGLFL